MTAYKTLEEQLEALKPTPEEVQEILDAWPTRKEVPEQDQAEKELQFQFGLAFLTDLATFYATTDLNTDDEDGDDGAIERALDMFADFINRTDPEKN